MMHGHEKSDSAIVAVKPANKVERSAAEPVEPRAETKGNVGQQSTRRTQSRISVSQLLARIRHIVAVDTRGGSRMRESCTYGSVRGVRGNSHPYRDVLCCATLVGLWHDDYDCYRMSSGPNVDASFEGLGLELIRSGSGPPSEGQSMFALTSPSLRHMPSERL
jgi:hypothetical protein